MSRLGIIGIVSALLRATAGGTYLLVNTDELQYTYICPSNGNVGVFPGGTSSSGLTAYIYAGNSTGSKRCSVPWEKCDVYAAKNNFTCVDALPAAPCNDSLVLPSWNLTASVEQAGMKGYEYHRPDSILLVFTNSTQCLDLS